MHFLGGSAKSLDFATPKKASGTSASAVPLWRIMHGDGFGVLLLARSSGVVWWPFFHIVPVCKYAFRPGNLVNETSSL